MAAIGSDSSGSTWFKSSFSQPGGCCLEVRIEGDQIHVRDTKDAEAGPVLTYTADEWNAFLAGAKAGEFDLS